MGKGIFISVGGNATQYYSDQFYNYLFNKPVSDNPRRFNALNKFNFSKKSACPIFAMGLELATSKRRKIKLKHIIEVSYMRFSHSYTGSSYVTAPNLAGYLTQSQDTFRGKCTQSMVTLGYKLQPTYKFLFCSIGVSTSINFIRINQHEILWSPFQGEMGISWNVNTVDNNYNWWFINFPLQIGVGGNIKLKKIILKPAFYFTSCFMKGYNFYNLSLEALYKF